MPLPPLETLQWVRDFFTDYAYLDHVVDRNRTKRAIEDKQIVSQRIEIIYDALLSIHADWIEADKKAKPTNQSQMDMLADLAHARQFDIDPRDVIELNPVLQKLAIDKILLERDERELLHHIRPIIERANTALQATRDTLSAGDVISDNTTAKIEKGIAAAEKILTRLEKEVAPYSGITMEMALKHFAEPKNFDARHADDGYHQRIMKDKHFKQWCTKLKFNGSEYEPEIPASHFNEPDDQEPYKPVRTDNMLPGPDRQLLQLEDQSKPRKSKKLRSGWVKNVAISAALLTTGALGGYEIGSSKNAPKEPEKKVRTADKGNFPVSIKIMREGPKSPAKRGEENSRGKGRSRDNDLSRDDD